MTTEQKVTRKLKAILSADVKGYSLLMDSKFEKKITFDIELSNILIEKILPN
jgi:hypothetical protein